MQHPEFRYEIHDQRGVYFVTLTVVQWVDIFTRERYVETVLQSLRYHQRMNGLIIYSWCLMSNHLHMVIRSENGTLSDTLHNFMRHTEDRIIEQVMLDSGESRRDWMLSVFASVNEDGSHQLWRMHYKPKELSTHYFTRQKINYIHRNPVKSGWVERAEDYRFSSARDYAGEKGLLNVEVLRTYAG